MACDYFRTDSFDYGLVGFDTPDAPSYLGGASYLQIVGAPYNHTGPYGLYIQGGGSIWVRYAVPSTPSNVSVGVWLKFHEFASQAYNANNTAWIRAHLTTGEYIDIRWDGVNHNFDGYVDGVKVVDGSLNIPEAWIHIQFYVFIDNAGFIRTRLNGTDDLNYSGDTLPSGAAAAIDYVYFWAGGAHTFYIDDVVLGLNDWTGDIRVEYIAPDGDTALNDWSPSTGVVNYVLIDEVPPNEADYTESNVNDDEIELQLPDWAGVGSTPILVTAIARAFESKAVGASVEIGVDSGGVDDVTQYLMTSQWRYYRHAMPLDPNGLIAWTDPAIDALLLRYKSVI